MKAEWVTRLIQAAAVSLAMAAILQELEKAPEERKWCGYIARYVPYDFNLPDDRRLIFDVLIKFGFATVHGKAFDQTCCL